MSFAIVALLASVSLAPDLPVQNAQQTPPNANNITLEMLAREGYEVKAIQSATTRGFEFVVMLQRSADIRSCLMRISRGNDGRPVRQSVCF